MAICCDVLDHSIKNSVLRAERTCDALELFLPSHEQALNELRRRQYGVRDTRVLDLDATYASFRLFFMVTNRSASQSTIDRMIYFYIINADLVQNIVDDPIYTPLTNEQRVAAMFAAGLELNYGFVWKSQSSTRSPTPTSPRGTPPSGGSS